MERSLPFRRAWIFGAALFLLAAVCGILAFLQYRWIGEVANAEQQRLQQDLQRNLNFVRRDFNSQIALASNALLPSAKDIEQLGRNRAYLARYQAATEATKQSFSRVALAVPENDELVIFILDPRINTFHKAAWPLGWAKLRERLSMRLSGRPAPAEKYRPEGVAEFPRFSETALGSKRGRQPSEQEWLIVEFDRDYLRGILLPALLQHYLTESGEPQYSVVVTESADRWQEVYHWGPKNADRSGPADAWVTLFELDEAPFRGPAPRGAAQDASAATKPEPSETPAPGNGVWTLRANHPEGSLQSIVERARLRNLYLVAGLLSLLIATVFALIRFTRGTEKLAEIQMNFVSGISHELRTPLAVLRAAGFNLRTRFARQPEQVERYGQLIQDESEKLNALVEQILRYGSVQSGRIIGASEFVEIHTLLEESLPGSRQSIAEAGITIQEKIAANLPPIKADRESLKHALRNLIENAVKHGTRGKAWVGITADRANVSRKAAVRIGILDNGPGIPKEERKLVFQPFFRGKLADENQVHGTGLGLNLAKRIIEAHGGTLTLRSELGKGTEFIVTIPASSAHQS
jgi:signal transduction histidine kinase